MIAMVNNGVANDCNGVAMGSPCATPLQPLLALGCALRLTAQPAQNRQPYNQILSGTMLFLFHFETLLS